MENMINNVIKIGSLNSRMDTPEQLINMAEENYHAYVQDAARYILVHADSPIVLLSGPSGSGKTTTAHKLAESLRRIGAKARVLSMDNYFLPMKYYTDETVPRDEEGNIDYESPLRLDIELFSDHLQKLAEGQTVQMPEFDFVTQDRYGFHEVSREKHEYLIIEGIHALNPMVTQNADAFCTCVYVAVRTRLITEQGSELHPRQIRLLRRICRDKLFRNRSPLEVFSMFKSVTRGEAKFIVPYRTRADVEIDTFMLHEPSVYKAMIYNELVNEENSLTQYDNYEELIRFLGDISSIDPALIPEHSLTREFIGDLGREKVKMVINN